LGPEKLATGQQLSSVDTKPTPNGVGVGVGVSPRFLY